MPRCGCYYEEPKLWTLALAIDRGNRRLCDRVVPACHPGSASDRRTHLLTQPRTLRGMPSYCRRSRLSHRSRRARSHRLQPKGSLALEFQHEKASWQCEDSQRCSKAWQRQQYPPCRVFFRGRMARSCKRLLSCLPLWSLDPCRRSWWTS